jgi:hypothetical protein
LATIRQTPPPAPILYLYTDGIFRLFHYCALAILNRHYSVINRHKFGQISILQYLQVFIFYVKCEWTPVLERLNYQRAGLVKIMLSFAMIVWPVLWFPLAAIEMGPHRLRIDLPTGGHFLISTIDPWIVYNICTSRGVQTSSSAHESEGFGP